MILLPCVCSIRITPIQDSWLSFTVKYENVTGHAKPVCIFHYPMRFRPMQG